MCKASEIRSFPPYQKLSHLSLDDANEAMFPDKRTLNQEMESKCAAVRIDKIHPHHKYALQRGTGSNSMLILHLS